MTENSSNLETSGTLDIHKEWIGGLYKSLELVSPLLLLWGRIQQVNRHYKYISNLNETHKHKQKRDKTTWEGGDGKHKNVGWVSFGLWVWTTWKSGTKPRFCEDPMTQVKAASPSPCSSLPIALIQQRSLISPASLLSLSIQKSSFWNQFAAYARKSEQRQSFTHLRKSSQRRNDPTRRGEREGTRT